MQDTRREMFKSLLQSLLGLTGYAFVSKRRFGWDIWQDISTLMGPVSNPVIFDVGAHAGETLATAKREFPTANLYCFEPDPDSFRALSKVSADFSRVSLYQLALGDVSGSFDFFRNAESMTNSLLPASLEAAKGEVAALMANRETITVSVITLDDFCAEHRVERIDLLKIDCQGFDCRVLKGAEQMLAEKRVSVIQCEAIFDPQYAGQGWFHEVLGFLTRCDYALCNIGRPARNSHYEMAFADALFKPRFEG
jgi:FkbM family methyltransferase